MNCITTVPQLEEFLQLLDTQFTVACDTETDGLDFYRSHIIGFSFAFDPLDTRHSYYLPIRHNTGEKQLPDQYTLDRLRPWFTDPARTTIWHNAAFDLLMLKSENIEIGGTLHDTLILHFLLDENGSHRLGDLAHRHLSAPHWKDAIAEELKLQAKLRSEKFSDLNYSHTRIPVMAEYACADARWTLELWYYFLDHLDANGFTGLYNTEVDLIRVLVDMQFTGVRIDTDYFEELRKTTEITRCQLAQKINAIAQAHTAKREAVTILEEKIADPAATPTRKKSLEKQLAKAKQLNIDSPKQLREFLKSLGAPIVKLTPTGKMSVDKLTLMRLAKKYPVAQDILDCRAKTKLITTYIDGMLGRLDAQSYLHTNFNTTGARTGRLSSSKPNLQNIPRGPEIRRAFIVPDNQHIFISIDFSQIELRLAAHYSQDDNMLEIYRKNGDIHARTAQICRCPSRQEAKPINFGLLYGMGWRSLIDNAYKDYGIVFTQAQSKSHFRNFWYKAYPKLREWVEEEKRFIRKYRYSENFFGRKRRVPEISKNIPDWQKEKAIRGAVNHIIQGTAADMLKLAMVRVWKYLQSVQAKSRMILTIHDEICFYWHVDEYDLLNNVIELMEDWADCNFRVPILTDVAYSKTSWGDKKELKL